MSLFSFDSVSVAFGERQVLKEFSLAVSEGEKVVLRGASGSGKSTLLGMLLGFVRPDSGTVRFQGAEITPEVVREIRKTVVFVNQAVELEPGTVAGALAEMFSIKASGDYPGEEKLEGALKKVGLSKRVLGQEVQDLSGGERHRIGLAIGLLLGRSVFLLDEPTAALDLDLKKVVADLFLKNPEWTVLAVAHDPVWFEGRDEVTVVDLNDE